MTNSMSVIFTQKKYESTKTAYVQLKKLPDILHVCNEQYTAFIAEIEFKIYNNFIESESRPGLINNVVR